MKQDAIEKHLSEGKLAPLFSELYGEDGLDGQSERWTALVKRHGALYGEQDMKLFSTPGRTELGGNHTDHNHGRVLASSINLDTIAAVSLTGDNTVIIDSEGYPAVKIDISNLKASPAEEGKTDALIRGIAARFNQLGYKIGGFRANTASSVLKGSGLSSSAALEVLVGTIFSTMFNDDNVPFTEIAKIGQYSENNYFGKPCGLMDQIACTIGGIVAIDFKDSSNPKITAVDYNFNSAGYTLMVVDTGGNHADLTPEYSAIPREMKAVAAHFGKDHCREIGETDILSEMKALRKKTGDRAILRALHFLHDNARVESQVEALKSDDITTYLHQVSSSGRSSFCYLQNVYAGSAPEEQGISLALNLTESFLHGEGACRVHGGGFAGTIQVYIPNERVQDYIRYMSPVFGEASLTPLWIRPLPSMMILE